MLSSGNEGTEKENTYGLKEYQYLAHPMPVFAFSLPCHLAYVPAGQTNIC
jgi:hypothetical protein